MLDRRRFIQVAIAAAGGALAPQGGRALAAVLPAPPSTRGLEAAARMVDRAIAILERETRDYGGWLGAAIDDLRSASEDLERAIEAARHLDPWQLPPR